MGLIPHGVSPQTAQEKHAHDADMKQRLGDAVEQLGKISQILIDMQRQIEDIDQKGTAIANATSVHIQEQEANE